MKLAVLHARVLVLELARHPAYVVPTLAFPVAFFLFFAVPGKQVDPDARMATFAGFAAIGVAFFQFGVGIAAERASPWETFLRTLPLGVGPRIGARLLSAAVFACAAAVFVGSTAVLTTSVSLSWKEWVGLAAALLAGTAPFASLGIALGYVAPAKAALPIANLLYLTLSYAGGLWIPADRLPHVVARLSPWLPTRALADALTAQTRGSTSLRAWLLLAAFAGIFAVFAAWGYRRDEGRRYG